MPSLETQFALTILFNYSENRIINADEICYGQLGNIFILLFIYLF